MNTHALAQLLQQVVLPLPEQDDLRAVLELIGETELILLGESTHGSSEFYRLRSRITQALFQQGRVDAMAVEADWPDALRVARFVRAEDGDLSAEQALQDFQRFPLWMWRNQEILALAEWLREANSLREPRQRVGFYGLDLYSLRTSMGAVIDYLERTNPTAARQARERYSCFDQFAPDPQRYGYAASFGELDSCEPQVVAQLLMLQQQRADELAANYRGADEQFYAEQNARVVRDGEAYYRAMYHGRHASWNLRDTHMADTLDALRQHLHAVLGRPPRIVVWAHNSHLGDARATEMGRNGEINLGQLMRERHGEDKVFLLGFTTHTGAVTAAHEWDSPARIRALRPSREDSIEYALHATGLRRLLLPLRGRHELKQALAATTLLERAVGVIYLPETERISHYFEADVGAQFDALLHVDATTALHPLDKGAHWKADDQPETWPSGL
jgi:erythromycin esterase-like protein